MKTRIIRAGLTMSSMLVTPAALAQAAPDASAPAPASANVSAQTAGASSAQSSNVNADIIVTAQRREERLRDVPLTITARSADDLAKAGVTSARELAVVVPGLTYTTQGAWAEPAIRGISTSLSHAGADTPIAIYVDGFYQANQIGNVFDLADIRQVEVLKGPQGTLFGRNATGGAILIHTLDPTDTFTGNLSISDGVFTGGSARTSNDLTLKGFVGGPIVKDVLSFSLSGYYGHTDGYLTNDVDGKRVGEIDSKLIRGKLKFTPTDTLRFTLSAMYTDRSDATGSNLYPYNGVSNATQLTLDPASGTYVPAFPGVFAPTKPWHVASEYAHGASISAKSYAIDLRSEWDIGQLGTLTSLTGYSHSKSDTLVNVDSAYSTPSCTASFTCVGIFVDYPSKTWQQELSFSSKKFSIFTLTAGLFYYHDKAGLAQDINPPVDADGHIDVKTNPGPLDTDAHITTKAWAGFGEIYADVTDRLRLVGGLRYSWEQKSGVFRAAFGAPYLPYPTIPGVTAPEKSWHSVTPRASVLYKATDELNLYFTFSKGFKSGVFDSTCNTCPYANPENLTSFEGGLKFGSRVASFNLSAFYYNYKDLQIQFFNGLTSQLSNAARAKLYGLDADGTFRLVGGLSARLAASWIPHAKYDKYQGGGDFAIDPNTGAMTQISVDATGFRMLKSPKLTGSASLNYKTDTGMGTLEAGSTLYYSSAFNWDLLGRVQTKRYATLSTIVSLTPTSLPVKFSIWGKNLTNQAYVSGAVLSGFSDGVIFGAPREIGITVDYKF